MYGVEASPRRAQDAAALAAFLPYVEAVALDEDAALHYAEIRADLKRRGATIGANDLFIAAHARAPGLTLVTNNTAEFERSLPVGDRRMNAPLWVPVTSTRAANLSRECPGRRGRSPAGTRALLVGARNAA